MAIRHRLWTTSSGGASETGWLPSGLNRHCRRTGRASFSTAPRLRHPKEEGAPVISPATISALRRQAITNAEAAYESLPLMVSGLDQVSLKDPKSFLKPRLHISSLPRLALKLTRPAKETDAYGLNFGVINRVAGSSTSKKQSSQGEGEVTTSSDRSPSLIDQALIARSQSKSKILPEALSVTRLYKTPFGSENRDPSCHDAASPVLAVSHKKLRKLSHLINQHRLTVDQAILQMKFSHKAIASKVMELLLKAKQDAIERGFKPNGLMIAQSWVTKGFHTTELQVRARGRHGKMTHPTSKFNVKIVESSTSHLTKYELKRKIELVKSKKRLKQRGTVFGNPTRLPSDGILPSSVEQHPHWCW